MARKRLTDTEIRRALLARLLEEPGAAEASHFVVAGMVLALLWQTAPLNLLFSWLGAVAALSVIRVVVRREARHSVTRLDRTPALLRVAIIAVAFAWGIGAVLVAPLIPVTELALLLVVFCGLAFAATATLLGDPPTFYGYLAGMLGLPAIGVLRVGGSRIFIAAFGLLLFFGIVIAVLYRRLHAILLEALTTARDLETSRAEAEDERNFLEALVGGAPMAIVVLDANQRVLRVNPAFERMFGYPSDEAIGVDIDALVLPEGERASASALRAQIAVGETVTADGARRRRDGSAVYARISAAGLPGRFASTLVIYDDITASRERGRRVAARNAVVRVLAEVTDESGVVTGALQAVCESFEWSAGAMWRLDRAAGVLRLAELWHDPGAPLAEFARVSRDLSFAVGEGVPGRIWGAGSALWIADFAHDAMPGRARAAAAGGVQSALGFPIRVGGAVVGVLEFFGAAMHEPDPALIETLQSIGVQMAEALERREAEAARHEAEAQYRELVEASSDMVWRIDATGCLTFLNQAAERIYGRPVRDLIGRPYAELSDPGRLAADREAMGAVFAGGELFDYETVHRGPTGDPVHLSTSARPIRDAAGAIVGVQGIARDVGERAAAREALHAARDAAEQAAAARSAFLANMSHEIRTPINGVLGMAELLLDSDLREDDRRSVEMIVASGEALLGVINDILDFSKIEAQQMDIERTEFDLPAVAEATARLLMPKANEKSVELVTDIPDTVPQYVVGDPTRLRQVLTNLVSNAVKFTAAGEVVIHVAPVAGAADRLRFSVRDTGIGIPPEQRNAIFEPFRQADATTTRRFGGTGLGLSISRRLVSLMGGVLEVQSTVGAGSTFSFELTLPRAAQPAAAAVPRVNLTGARVLVVDDNPTNRDVVRRAFERAGCPVDDASGGPEALGMLRAAAERRVPYQLVVTDVFMPVMDGFDFVTAIRAEPSVRGVRVLMLSSAARRGDGDRVRELDVSAFLLKPAGRAELLAAAGVALGLAADRAARASAPNIAMPAGGTGVRVLLAEDNLVNQEVAATMLRRRGHTVDVVADGRQAVNAVAGAAYDVVLMDLQMPEMDGVQATAEIRRHLGGRPLPIVALTANAMIGERERCLAAGMDDYLSKPFKPHELFAMVESWAGKAAAAGTAAAQPAHAADGDAADVAAFRAEMRDAGAEEAVDSVLAVFVHDAPVKMKALEAAAASGDKVALARSAHAFKSSSGAIHADRLAALLRTIELESTKGHVADATARLAETRTAYEAVMRQLKPESGKTHDG